MTEALEQQPPGYNGRWPKQGEAANPTLQTALMNVRYVGNNGRPADVTRCLLMTQSGRLETAATGLP